MAIVYMMDWSMMEEGDQDHEKSPRHSAQLQSPHPAELLVQDPLYIFSSERHVRQKCVEVSSSVIRVSSQLRNSLGIHTRMTLERDFLFR